MVRHGASLCYQRKMTDSESHTTGHRQIKALWPGVYVLDYDDTRNSPKVRKLTELSRTAARKRYFELAAIEENCQTPDIANSCLKSNSRITGPAPVP